MRASQLPWLRLSEPPRRQASPLVFFCIRGGQRSRLQSSVPPRIHKHSVRPPRLRFSTPPSSCIQVVRTPLQPSFEPPFFQSRGEQLITYQIRATAHFRVEQLLRLPLSRIIGVRPLQLVYRPLVFHTRDGLSLTSQIQVFFQSRIESSQHFIFQEECELALFAGERPPLQRAFELPIFQIQRELAPVAQTQFVKLLQRLTSIDLT